MLNWKGEQVYNRTLLAAGRAVDGVLADCVSESKRRVPVRTSIIQGSIQMRPAIVDFAGRVVGLWGSFAVKYALWVEKGTQAHVILPRTKKALYWKGAAHPVPRVFHPGSRPHPFLFPVMEEKAKWLPIRLRMEMEAGR